ncbi:MAG: VWA-like domain-containing protein [Treponema sp.]|nr:VWA-like domain-containing protein [Treponema sp.]
MSGTEERIRDIAGRWYLREPLLLMTLLSHRLEPNDSITTLRSGKGRLEYNRAFLESLGDEALEEKLKIEVFRLLLRHPYRQARGNDPSLSYMASNITLNEYYPFNDLNFHAADYWEDPLFFKQNFEFYCRELKKLGDGVRDDGTANAGEKTGLWDDDDYMDQKLKGLVAEAATSHSWGSLSGELIAILTAGLRPAVDYRKILLGFRALVLSSEKILTRFKQSRRYGLLFLGRKNQFTTRILIGIDVSGSVSDAEIDLFYSTVNRFFRYGVNSLELLQFDAALKGEPVLMKQARKTIRVTGRGGTDFQPLCNYFEENEKRYDGLIVFTDGFAAIPALPRRLARKTLWLCNNRTNYDRHRPWMSRLGRCAWIE